MPHMPHHDKTTEISQRRDDDSDRGRYRPAPASAPQPGTERRDARKLWLPVSSIGAAVLAIGGVIWWAAGRSADIDALRRDRDAGEKRDADCVATLAEHTKAIQALNCNQATILANLEAIRAEVQRNSTLLEDLRRRP